MMLNNIEIIIIHMNLFYKRNIYKNMNIKVVFKNNIHKLPSSVNNFNEIKENIRCLYPNKL